MGIQEKTSEQRVPIPDARLIGERRDSQEKKKTQLNSIVDGSDDGEELRKQRQTTMESKWVHWWLSTLVEGLHLLL